VASTGPSAAVVCAQSAPRVVSLPLEEGERAMGALMADVDGDGVLDLVVARSRADSRELVAFRGRTVGAPLEVEPHWRLGLPGDVVAFALGDVVDGPQADPVLISGRGVFAARPGAPEAERYLRLVELPVLWQLSPKQSIAAYPELLVDLDGDGRVDLLVPTASGYSALRQVRNAAAELEGSAFEALGEARLPDTAALAAARGLARNAPGSEDSGVSVRVRLGVGGVSRAPTLLAVTDSVPAPFVVPWSGPRNSALVALDDRFLHVWPIGTGGALTPEPAASHVSPVELDPRRRLDVSYVALLADLDRDGREDVVLVASDQRSKDVRTQVLVYTHAATAAGEPAPFGAAGRPAQVLVLAGFVGNVRIEDVDGDGHLDLVATSVRPDLLESLRQAATDRVQAELYVYRGEGGRFARRPALTRILRFAVQDADPLVRFATGPSARGPASLLLREEPGSLAYHALRGGKDGTLDVLPQPLWRLGLHPEAQVLLFAGAAGLPDTVVALEPNQVLVGRWR